MPIYGDQWFKEAPQRDLKHAEEMEKRRKEAEAKRPDDSCFDNVGVPRGSRLRPPKGFVMGGD